MATCVDMPSFGWLHCTLTVPTSVLGHDVKGSLWMYATLVWVFFFFNLETESHCIAQAGLEG